MQGNHARLLKVGYEIRSLAPSQNKTIKMKKPKQINLSEKAIENLSIMAIKAGTNFKNYVEGILERTAVKAVRQKRTK